MRSCPKRLRGEVAGRKTRGVASVTLSAGGKEMTEDSATELLTLVEALQVREVVMGCRVHAPAVAAVVLALAQHWQAVQPTVSMALELQQQPA